MNAEPLSHLITRGAPQRQNASSRLAMTCRAEAATAGSQRSVRPLERSLRAKEIREEPVERLGRHGVVHGPDGARSGPREGVRPHGLKVVMDPLVAIVDLHELAPGHVMKEAQELPEGEHAPEKCQSPGHTIARLDRGAAHRTAPKGTGKASVPLGTPLPAPQRSRGDSKEPRRLPALEAPPPRPDLRT